MGARVRLAEILLPSTELDLVSMEDTGGLVRIRYSRGRGRERLGGTVEFEDARAYRYRAESHCTEWHVEAYDTLLEVEGSPWIDELIAVMPSDLHDLFHMHHYMIYLDGVGCYEVVAGSWRCGT